MRVCLYNSFPEREEGSSDKIIWCPLSGDILNIVRFFRKSYNEKLSLCIESVFRKYFSEESCRDISFFDAERSSHKSKIQLIAFYSQSDTLANNTLCLISEDPAYKYVNYVPAGNAENADKFFEENKIPFNRYSYRHLKDARPDVLVLYNDWTKAAIRVISQCHLLRIPVVCIQESIVNFGDSFRRMERADDVMIQGIRSALMLQRRHFYLTGNPRYSHSGDKKMASEYALINCNFTYNIFNEVREVWLNDVTSALDELGINYIISQHPRDTGDLGKYKNVIRSSSAGTDEQLGRAGLLISRFSSLIHESLIRGVPVVYYNPHSEEMNYDFGFDAEFLAVAGEKKALKELISRLYKKNISGKGLESYLSEHCLPAETKPVSNINHVLSGNKFSDVRFSPSDLLHLILYQPFILSIVRKIKQVLTKSPEPEN
jgi:hypothetical protein